jgi:transcriptional regulator with GAF, ATPase, and Fis domain
MGEVLKRARRVAQTSAKVLITGESGVGKDLIARYIHAHSSRAGRPLITVNCAAFSDALLESELFGHVKGSFTGAHRDKVGKFQLAHGSTLFLDEVGEMSLRMQALLLRAIEYGEIQPVGTDGCGVLVNVRIVAATNRDLRAMVAAGQFREDLFYRINVTAIDVPPLRERPEDIPLIIEHIARECSDHAAAFSPAATQALLQHRWPGNIRELQNVVVQAICMAEGDVIHVHHLPPLVRQIPRAATAAPLDPAAHIADDLFAGIVDGRYGFWEHLHKLFLNRDITRHDVRQVVSRGLTMTRGSYRSLVKVFRMEDQDYKKLLNFLSTHNCTVDCRSFREACWMAEPPAQRAALVPPAAAASDVCGGATV